MHRRHARLGCGYPTAVADRHRVPPGSTVRIGTADFDLTATSPYRRVPESAMEVLI